VSFPNGARLVFCADFHSAHEIISFYTDCVYLSIRLYVRPQQRFNNRAIKFGVKIRSEKKSFLMTVPLIVNRPDIK